MIYSQACCKIGANPNKIILWINGKLFNELGAIRGSIHFHFDLLRVKIRAEYAFYLSHLRIKSSIFMNKLYTKLWHIFFMNIGISKTYSKNISILRLHREFLVALLRVVNDRACSYIWWIFVLLLQRVAEIQSQSHDHKKTKTATAGCIECSLAFVS